MLRLSVQTKRLKYNKARDSSEPDLFPLRLIEAFCSSNNNKKIEDCTMAGDLENERFTRFPAPAVNMIKITSGWRSSAIYCENGQFDYDYILL